MQFQGAVGASGKLHYLMAHMQTGYHFQHKEYLSASKWGKACPGVTTDGQNIPEYWFGNNSFTKILFPSVQFQHFLEPNSHIGF